MTEINTSWNLANIDHSWVKRNQDQIQSHEAWNEKLLEKDAENIMKDKGSIKVNFRDFLGIQQWSGYSKYQNLDVTIHNHWDSRSVNVSFTYRFNKGQTGEQRRHSGGADEEQGRVKSGRG